MNNNPLRVSLDNIIPLTEARDHFSSIVNEVQKDKLYVLTKGGKPAVAIVDVKYLEYISGGHVNATHVEAEIQKNPAKVGRPQMIKHDKPAPAVAPIEPKNVVIPPPPATPPIASTPNNPPQQQPVPQPAEPQTQVPTEWFDKKEVTSAGGGTLITPASDQGKAGSDTINVQMTPDSSEEEENEKDSPSTQTALGSLTSPDDEANPAQYAGETEEEDEHDMPID